MNRAVIEEVFEPYLDQRRWLDWRLVGNDKIPFTPGTDRMAKVNEPETWGTYAECKGDKRGIVFNGDGLGGVDCDACRDPKIGDIAPWALDQSEAANSYAEVSPSGTGFKIFTLGAPAKLGKNTVQMLGPPINGKQPQIERYVTGRWFAVTGEQLSAEYGVLRHTSKFWEQLDKLFKASPRQRTNTTDMASRGRNCALFSLACRLQANGASDRDIEAALREANRQGNLELHPNFADGPLSERNIQTVLRSALQYEKGAPDARVVIQLKKGTLHKQATVAEDALVAAGAPLFTQSGQLVRPIVEEADAARGRKTLVARIAPCLQPWLLRQMSETVRCLTWYARGGEWVDADVPDQLAASVLASASPKFSELVGIIETPTLRPDGSILAHAGYDPVTGLLLANPPTMPDIPDKPSRGDALAALALLDSLLDEFPFKDKPSRSVTLSGLMTPVVRGAMEAAPMHVATAPVAGSGKSFIGDLVAAIATGKRCPVLSLSERDEENEKRLHGAALAGQPLIALDNVNGVLRGDFLAQLVTQPRLQVRRLGSTGNLEIANCATVLANGNNIEIEGDLVRRTLRGTLDPELEDPTTRQFKGDPFRTILADRGKYVAAVLTVVRAHLVAGFPGKVPPFGSFEDWSRLVRGALVWLGRADPVETQEGLRAADPALGPLDLLIDAWATELGNNKITAVPLTVKELTGYNLDGIEQALRSATSTREFDTLSTVKVGKFLKRFDGRIRNGVKLQGVYDQHRKQQTWQLLGWEQFLAKRTEDAKVVSIETARKPTGARKANRRPASDDGKPYY